MRFDRKRKLEQLGFDSEWLDEVYDYWTPKKNGKYEMTITWIEDLDDDPRKGVLVEKTRFNDDKDLSITHHFFEGLAYVMTDVTTGKEIGVGTIDGSPFDECADFEGTDWHWSTYTTEDIINMSPKLKRYYKTLEKDYHKKVKENRELKNEIARLRKHLDAI